MIEKLILIALISSVVTSETVDEIDRRVIDAVLETRNESTTGAPTDTSSQVVPKLNDTKLNETTPEATPETTVAPKKYHNAQVGDDQWEPEGCKCLDDRYLVHYQERGCTEVKSELFCRKPCPKYFDCPKKDSNVDGCEYKGKIYKDREVVPVDHPCKKGCFCDSRWTGNCTKSSITCAYVECPNDFRPPEHNPNCFYVYEEGMCCPKRKCLKPEDSQRFICVYEGKPYRFGQKIYPKEDPCLECICEQNWDARAPLASSGCRKIKCDLQLNPNFRAGCLPIYHEKSCCPIDYFCPPPEEQQCKFNGKTYLVGETVNINRERTDCKCLIPPELTCIEKSQ